MSFSDPNRSSDFFDSAYRLYLVSTTKLDFIQTGEFLFYG